MAREIGDILITGAQAVVQQLQNQQQLSLQMAQFGQQIQAAEESLRLRESNIALEKEKLGLQTEKNQLDAELAQARLQVSQGNLSVAERNAAVAEGNLNLNQSFQGLRRQIDTARLENIQTRTKKLEKDLTAVANGEADFRTVSGRFAINKLQRDAENLVAADPERFIKTTPDVMERFRGFSVTALEQHRSTVSRQLMDLEGQLSGAPAGSRIRQRLGPQLENLRNEVSQTTDYLTQLQTNAFEISSGRNKDAQRELLRGLFPFADDPDQKVDQLLALTEAQALDSPGVTELTLTTALLNPETRSPKTVGQLISVADGLPSNLGTEAIESTASLMDDILQPTESLEVFSDVIRNFERLSLQRNPEFDPASMTPIWIELGKRRGLQRTTDR